MKNTKVDNGGSAFPIPDVTWPENHIHGKQGTPGMTLRNFFASSALTGLLQNQYFKKMLSNEERKDWIKAITILSYGIADSMIRLSNKQVSYPPDEIM